MPMEIKPYDLYQKQYEAYRRYMQEQELIRETSEVYDYLWNNCKLMHSSMVDGWGYTSGGWMHFIFNGVEIETVQSHVCPVVWQKFGTPWKMDVPDETHVILKNRVSRNIDVWVSIYPPRDTDDCLIIKVPKRIKSDIEIQEMRIEYEYKLDCADHSGENGNA